MYVQKPLDPGTLNKMYTRTGYLYCMEKKALGTTWIKCYCQYIRENRWDTSRVVDPDLGGSRVVPDIRLPAGYPTKSLSGTILARSVIFW